MGGKWLVLLLVALVWIWPGSAVAEIDSSTTFRLDLTNANEAAKKAKWSETDRITVRPEGLGWGHGNDQGSRDVWLQTEAMGIGLSWRPTSMASIKAVVERPGTSGMLYARYSADGKHWTTWQYLEADAAAANGPTKVFRVRSAFPIASAHPTTSYGWSMPGARMCPGAAMRRPWSRKSSKASRGFSRGARPSSGTCSSSTRPSCPRGSA